MRVLLRIQLLTYLALLAACSSGGREAGQACPASWSRQATSDSALTLCLPEGFAPSGQDSWVRPAPASGAPPRQFLAAHVLGWPEDSASTGGWPPRLLPDAPCTADCLSVDSLIVQTDTLAGGAATITTGLVSGGFAGFRSRPTLVAGWIISDRRRGFVQGWALDQAGLDTLRRAIRTVAARP